MILVGIDPGLRSAAAGVIDHNGRFLACFDIPSVADRINVREFKLRLIKHIPGGHWVDFIVENVWIRPDQGSVSSANFMRATGAIEAVCELYRDSSTSYVMPQRWKKDMGLSSDKQLSLDMARELWPEADLKLKKDNNKAEALLLAEWMRRQL